MNFAQQNKPTEWVTDIDEKYLSPAQAFYIKNREYFTNIHGATFNGQNLGKSSPAAANYPACNLQMPGGENYSMGTYSCDRTSEVYIFILNSNKVSFIYRVNSKSCDIVYDEPCYKPSAEPKNAITQWRVWLDVKDTCKNWAGKRLFFTDGIFLGCIDVEASIATDSFTTPFFKDCSDPCDYISLCTATPFKPLRATFLPKSGTDRLLTNKIVDVGFQFMYRWVYYDGRTSIWSEPSSYYYQSADECFENENGFSRCMSLRIPLGNAMVSYIELAYRTDNNNQWFLAETIEKYKQYNNVQQQWYQTQLSEIVSIGYSNIDCAFDYTFCNDKECLAIPQSESDKVFIPFPREAQGLIPFGNSILWYNYKSGNCPLPRSVIDNVHIDLDCSNQESNCNKTFVEVTVYAVIHEFFHNRNQFIYTLESDPVNKTLWFGGLHPSESSGDFETGWGQRFNEKTKNFIAYIEGTEYFGEMKQYRKSANGVIDEFPQVTNMSDSGTQRQWRRFRNTGGFFFSKCTIRVPRGTKGFIRLTSHQETFANTEKSTFVEGVTNLNTYNGTKDLGPVINPGNLNPKQEEIFFDACGTGTSIDLITQAFIIKDNAIDSQVGSAYAQKASAVSGYIFDSNNEPVAGALVYYSDVFGNVSDHNGFYHVVFPGVDGDVSFKVKAETDCSVFGDVITQAISVTKGEMTYHDFKIDNVPYTNNNYIRAQVRVVDCNDYPIEGIRVALSGHKSGVTNGLGEIRFKVRNYFTRNRAAKAIIMDKKGCFEIDCANNCNPCMPSFDTVLPACFISGGIGTNIISIGTGKINVTALLHQGSLKSGGRYGFGAIVKGDCGQLSFVNKGKYIDIPKKCGDIDDVCNLKYDLSSVILPIWAKSFTVVRTKNLNPFELQWVVDKAEYKDNKITITIQSLNDYNFKNFFESNTIYQYLKGDRVEIIADEKGKYYCESLNYQILSPFHNTIVSGLKEPVAKYFNQIIIEDDGRIGKIIKEGTIIELQRPADCKTEEGYYSIGAQFDTVLNAAGDGRTILNPKGIFSTFDTYKIRRKIGKSVPMTFEHHSPSDFWGDKVSDVGQVYIVNKFEDEVRKERNITISAANDFNYFGDLEKTIGDKQMGGLVAGNITDDKLLLWICENDNFINQTADDLLKIGSNGNVTAISEDEVLSNSQPKIIGKYGCQYDHIGSIYFGDGYATWADVNKHAYIKHDYQQATDVSFTKIKAWTAARFQQIETWNRAQTDPLNKYRFSTGYNHLNKMVMTTLKQLRHSGIDNEKEPMISPNETIIFRPEDDKFYGQSSCTPEAYGSLNSFNGSGCTYLTVQNGLAWLHPIIPQKVGSFFGVPVDQVIGICLNKFPEKNKVGLAIEIQDEMLWFAWKIKTSNPKFESEIPAVRWRKTEYKHSAEFLCNKNGRGGLYGNMKDFAGEKPNGYFISIIFVRDNTLRLAYQTIDNNKRQQYSELDNISFKFLTSEQNGFSENL